MTVWLGEYIGNFWIAMIGLVTAAFAWFVRTFITNQTQIAIITKDLNDIKIELAKIEAKNDVHVENQKEILSLLQTILRKEQSDPS